MVLSPILTRHFSKLKNEFIHRHILSDRFFPRVSQWWWHPLRLPVTTKKWEPQNRNRAHKVCLTRPKRARSFVLCSRILIVQLHVCTRHLVWSNLAARVVLSSKNDTINASIAATIDSLCAGFSSKWDMRTNGECVRHSRISIFIRCKRTKFNLVFKSRVYYSLKWMEETNLRNRNYWDCRLAKPLFPSISHSGTIDDKNLIIFFCFICFDWCARGALHSIGFYGRRHRRCKDLLSIVVAYIFCSFLSFFIFIFIWFYFVLDWISYCARSHIRMQPSVSVESDGRAL